MLLQLLCVLVLVASIGGNTINQDDVLDAVSNQIERPPEQEDEEEGNVEDFDYNAAAEPGVEIVKEEKDKYEFDVDYVVKRPTSPPPEDECDELNAHSSDELKEKCKKKDLQPYTKWKTYKNWKKKKIPLFVIIFGGLRWDYLTPSESNMTGKTVGRMKAFNWVKKNGVTISQVNPVFPPYDLPVWTSMATGLYPERHGVNGDYMFNLKTRDMFKRGTEGSDLDLWWKEGEPIWSLAASQRKKVSSLNWHDCTLPGKNIESIQDCKPFLANSTASTDIPSRSVLRQLFNQAFTKIHKDEYDLSIVYTDVLKKAAREHGPNSPQVMKSLALLDEVLQYSLSDIKNKKERAGLTLNLLVLSDYGFMDDTNTTKLVLEEYVNFDHCQMVLQRGGSVVLVPYALQAGDIMHGVGNFSGVANMVGVDAYVRDVNLEVPKLNYPEIPPELHYAGLKWTQDILLMAKPGFEIQIKTESPKVFPPLNSHRGSSGYHPNPPPPYQPGKDKHKSKQLRKKEKIERDLYTGFGHMMKSIAFAWGPDFKPGYVSDPIESVDLYQLLCFLLHINPNDHDGSWARVRPMLSLSSAPSNAPSLALIALVAVLLNKHII